MWMSNKHTVEENIRTAKQKNNVTLNLLAVNETSCSFFFLRADVRVLRALPGPEAQRAHKKKRISWLLKIMGSDDSTHKSVTNVNIKIEAIFFYLIFFILLYYKPLNVNCSRRILSL